LKQKAWIAYVLINEELLKIDEITQYV